ncbi:MAG TPA: DNA-directed RNA polymerase subunit beta' [Candidatus Moranbacteria bacterium]|nr:DNA-directed RNA polymerase subunit beta' [Candidatus Moranbacteria bacterium]
MQNNTGVSDFNSIRLSLASPEKILDWSSGEVTKPETINYRTQRYEKDGLFCEKIFGPSKDWECYCGKYKRIRYKGIVCDKCGVEVTRSNVRRERMGHIKLAVPVSHIWFLRSVPSRVGLALGLSYQELERVAYFSAYIVTHVDEEKRKDFLQQIEKEYHSKIKQSKGNDENIEEIKSQYNYISSEIKNLKLFQVLSEVDYFNLSSQAGQIFTAGIGAEAIRTLLAELDINKTIKQLKKELAESGKTKINNQKMLRRIKLLQGFKDSGLELEWMFPTVIPVIPPDLRPMVALNGGRYATSDLNDLYRRIINRNNRLKKLISLNAPEVITRNEKRMLQEAVDSLFDNSMRRSHASVAASTGQKRALRSLADSLKGKQGRFRQNLLGKRVDYSGRSVIVVGPHLKLHQVGLPKKMALELFKPFIINKLIEKEYAHNVRMAGRMVDTESEKAYAMLDNIIKKHYVLLNRAPTLHRLSIQAFQPVLIEGKAIQVHPMVCAAFNADFDGDQMAVHVPLTDKAREESANMMLSSKNLLKPASGDPITTPSLDIVLGIYYLTHIKENKKNKHIKAFSSIEEASLAHQNGYIKINSKIKVDIDGKVLETSVGRIMFNDLLPKEFDFVNIELTKIELKKIVSQMIETVGQEGTAKFVDDVKNLGFKMAGASGISWGMNDLVVPKTKKDIIASSEKEIEIVIGQYNAGLLTAEEKKTKSIEIWNEAKNKITEEVRDSLDKEGPVYAMVYSKARGSESVVVQMTGMKGLMADASGETIELPVKSSYKEGLNVLEYFMSTHGARKGMADTALRTATAGYLTRRLVDVSQNIVVREDDCGDTVGTYLYREDSDRIGQSFADRVVGRTVLESIIDPKSKEKLVKKGDLVTLEQAKAIEDAKIEKVRIRSVVACKTRTGVCQKCYGLDLGRGGLVKEGEAVGVVAAQAIGEPGTQLTMRTFHVGGVAGSDITQGLPRVEEIFEVRPPKGEALISEIAGKVKSIESDTKGKNVTVSVEGMDEDSKEKVVKEYQIPANITLSVEKGDLIDKGTVLSEGHIDLKKLYETMGQEEVHRYITREIQEIYASQGEGINDKHIEVIIRQMLSRISISDSGDTNLLVGDVASSEHFEEMNEKARKKGGEEAKGKPVILGITKVALSTESFLSAASFIETAKVLINASIQGKEDNLKGLKENIIIGRLIPAGSGFRK